MPPPVGAPGFSPASWLGACHGLLGLPPLLLAGWASLCKGKLWGQHRGFFMSSHQHCSEKSLHISTLCLPDGIPTLSQPKTHVAPAACLRRPPVLFVCSDHHPKLHTGSLSAPLSGLASPRGHPVLSTSPLLWMNPPRLTWPTVTFPGAWCGVDFQ